MTRLDRRWRARAARLAIVAIAAIGTAAAQQEPVLLHEDPGGLLELKGERRLIVRGAQMVLRLRQGKAGELRYMAAAAGDPGLERPVALWLDGETLRLERIEGEEESPLLLEVAISNGVSVRLDLVGAQVTVTGLGGDLEVHGRQLELQVRALKGALDLDLEESEVRANLVESDLTLEGRDLHATIEQVVGEASLSLGASEVAVSQVSGRLEADLEETRLRVATVAGGVRVTATGGSLELTDIARQGELRLEGTPLVLAGARGDFEIETSAEVRFRDHQGGLRIASFGGGVNGSGSSGELHVRTDGAGIALDDLTGPAWLEGRDLQIDLKELKGGLTVRAVGSDVRVQGANGELDVQTDFGDVEIGEATQAVKILSSGGNVRATGLRGPLELKADGPQVEVSWAQISPEKNSTIENVSGDVSVELPARGSYRLVATSEGGRIDSDLAAVRVAEDGSSASGMVGQTGRPLIKIVSGGNVYLTTAAGAGP